VSFDPAYLGLAVPFLLLVLLYFEKKRQPERRAAAAAAAEEVAAAAPTRQLQTLLFWADPKLTEPAAGESFRDFLRGAPTRRLTAGWASARSRAVDCLKRCWGNTAKP
jgi:hypothetical protein